MALLSQANMNTPIIIIVHQDVPVDDRSCTEALSRYDINIAQMNDVEKAGEKAIMIIEADLVELKQSEDNRTSSSEVRTKNNQDSLCLAVTVYNG